MTSPDYASEIRCEDFPDTFRQVVRDIGALVLVQTAQVRSEQQRLLAIPASELISAQRRSHFCLVDLERMVAREYAKLIAMDASRAE